MSTIVQENPLRRDPAETLPLSIHLEQGDTRADLCHTLPNTEYRGTYYESTPHALSVAVLPGDGHAYEYGCSVVARQNARYAANHGFRYQRVDRADWEDDLHAIRSSAPVRQGRAMPQAYMDRQTYGHDVPSDCLRHGSTVHGVIGPDDHLAGYVQVVQCGEVVRVNTILGHADLLEQRIMWLLMMETAKHHIDVCGARFFLYYTHLSGHGPGLRYFKERLGFRPHKIEWLTC